MSVSNQGVSQLPVSTDGTLASNSNNKLVTEQAIKTYADTKKTILDLMGSDGRESLTISSGVITLTGTRSYIAVDTQSSASTDDLDTISGGSSGDLLFVTAASGSRDVVLKDNTGNLRLVSDFTLDHQHDTIVLLKHADGNWVELCRSNNAT